MAYHVALLGGALRDFMALKVGLQISSRYHLTTFRFQTVD